MHSWEGKPRGTHRILPFVPRLEERPRAGDTSGALIDSQTFASRPHWTRTSWSHPLPVEALGAIEGFPHVLILGVADVAFVASSIGRGLEPCRPKLPRLGQVIREPAARGPGGGRVLGHPLLVVAMLLLTCEVEVAFTDPGAVVLRGLGWAGLWQMAAFLGIIRVAFV